MQSLLLGRFTKYREVCCHSFFTLTKAPTYSKQKPLKIKPLEYLFLRLLLNICRSPSSSLIPLHFLCMSDHFPLLKQDMLSVSSWHSSLKKLSSGSPSQYSLQHVSCSRRSKLAEGSVLLGWNIEFSVTCCAAKLHSLTSSIHPHMGSAGVHIN